MSNDNYTETLIGGYEKIFVNRVLKTYHMLKELDDVKNEEEFYELFYRIEEAYLEIESAKKKYYDLLIRDGGTAYGCSLQHEFEYGVDCIDEKYNAIKDTVRSTK